MGNQFRQAGIGIGSLLLALAALLYPVAALPDSQQTVHIAPVDHPRFQQVQRLLSDEISGAVLRGWSPGGDTGELVITLDKATLSEIRANAPEQPVLALFTSSGAIDSILPNRKHFSAIYSDPPLPRQARLGQLIIPRAGTVAILASPEQAGDYSELRSRLRATGLESRVFVIPSQDQLIRNLARALSYGDFLLGTPDRAIYNRETVKPLLLTSYRRNRLVIGPSRAFVDAGAVASTYTSARAQILEAGELIRHWLEHGELRDARYPEAFSVAVNDQVARSMDLLVPSEEELHRILERQEVKP
ncbi:ABC transporter substrate-binding protein [Halovibrio salipaludis]|uniref:ABC transporter substrate-binding protein n=1 Tax=Halovibrio salipaludis TaxID=2032626 RepID=UPI00117AD750|nr:ABC transporter substrate-binding protein [Halovibrio salipaludis]